MSYFLTFLSNHWLLCLILVILIVVSILIESQGKVSGILQGSPQQIVNLINREKAIVIDVRDAKAFCQGHIIHAQNIELDKLDQATKKIQKFKSAPVVVYDNSQGKKAITFAKALKNLGFQQVQCLQGGLQAWQKCNLPLIKEV